MDTGLIIFLSIISAGSLITFLFGGKDNTGVLETVYFQDMASPIGEQILWFHNDLMF